MLKAIIFDFDGVICESLAAKTRAFRKLFEDYPEKLTEILRIHTDNGGMSRYKKFELIFKNILKKELPDRESQRLGKVFSEYCYDEVVASPFVKGAYEFLKKYHDKLLFFIVSGTPQEEMNSLVSDRKLDVFFKGVYGSPRLKEELISTILRQNNLVRKHVIFVGDSVNDQQEAMKAGVTFIGRVSQGDVNPFVDLSKEQIIENIKELESILRQQKLIPLIEN